MDRSTFIKNYLRVSEQRLQKFLPKEASEGVYMFKAYQLVSRALGHIINGKLTVNGEAEEKENK